MASMTDKPLFRKPRECGLKVCNIRFRSSEGNIVLMVERATKCSQVLVDLAKTRQKFVQVSHSKAVLEKICVWADHHRDDPPMSPRALKYREKRTDDIPDWDTEFFNVDPKMFFEIIAAAEEFQMEGLLYLAHKSLAHMIKDKEPEEIRSMFQISNDFTPQEEMAIRNEISWCSSE